MQTEKRRFRFPLIVLLLVFVAAAACNLGATADPAGERPALNLVMTLVFIAAWALFFVCFQSRSKAAYIVSLVYWAFVFLYAAVNLGLIPFDAYIPTGTPLVLVSMALLAPLMGLLLFSGAGILLVFLIAAAGVGLSIYRLCKKSDAKTEE